MSETKQPTDPLHAYLDYFRDLGVYDFYRHGEPTSVDPMLSVTLVDEVVPEAIPQAPPESAIPVFLPSVALAHESETAAPAGSASLEDMGKLVSLTNRAPLAAERLPAGERAAALEALRQEIGDCTRCPLAYAGRHTIVFGDGDPNTRLMFVGEGPGADEDEQGLPFVGKSGQLLNNMITAMGLSREQVYIANIVKCRPPANRAPEWVEASTCTEFLARQMDIVQPEIVVALGATAAMYLLGVKQSLMSLRGKWHTVRGVKAVVTYHPAFLLRDPRKKGEAWKDLQMVMAEMGLKR